MKKDLMIISAITLVVFTVIQVWQWREGQLSTSAEVATMPIYNQDRIRYADYTPELFGQLQDQRRVLFFKANWCSTCTEADEDISQHTSQLPADVTILKVNFDTEKELRTKYGVTSQHTFVVVDGQGNLVNIWNGGGIEELVEKLS